MVEAGTRDDEVVGDGFGLTPVLIKRQEPLPSCQHQAVVVLVYTKTNFITRAKKRRMGSVHGDVFYHLDRVDGYVSMRGIVEAGARDDEVVGDGFNLTPVLVERKEPLPCRQHQPVAIHFDTRRLIFTAVCKKMSMASVWPSCKSDV